MKKNEKFKVLNAVLQATIEAIQMNDAELKEWFKTLHSPSTLKAKPKPPFPIAYKKDNNFEILNELILDRKDEIWGFEILPDIILAKKCGAYGNVNNTSWDCVKSFAEKCLLNGKKGSLPSANMLDDYWDKSLKEKIQAMDIFLINNGIDAEKRSAFKDQYVGTVWCSEADVHANASYYSLEDSENDFADISIITEHDRIAVAF